MAREPIILDDNKASSGRLNSLLHDLSDVLADNSSLVIKLGNFSVSVEYITRKKNAVFMSMTDFGARCVGCNANLNQRVVVAE